MTKLLIVCGPTASGKTAFALRMAKRLDGELVNADSRQMYRGLTVISGKDIPPGAESVFKRTVLVKGESFDLVTYDIGGIPVWLYDVANPARELSISHFAGLSHDVIGDIAGRGVLPVVVGGAGFYLSVFSRDIETIDIPQNAALRTQCADMSTASLQTMLATFDAEKLGRMNASDRANPRRLVRAIEVAAWMKHHPSPVTRQQVRDAYWVGIRWDKPLLAERIRQRVIERIAAGAVDEARHADPSGSALADSAIGLPFLREYLAGGISERTLTDTWTEAEVRYAKRQMTWFSAQPFIRWYDGASAEEQDRMEEDIASWYTDK